MLSEHEAAAENVFKYDGESHSSSYTYAGVGAVAVGDSHRLFVKSLKIGVDMWERDSIDCVTYN